MESYAQNFEDVILQRALVDVSTGFYVDVGANDPTEDSVTKAFYDQGWSGVNIEPVDEYFIRLSRDRARDVNLKLFISDTTQLLEFTVVDGSGLSTGRDLESDFFETRYSLQSKKLQIKPETLENVFSTYVGNRDVHFLKVDVEGFEERVLASLDLQKYRPWIIVVEKTEPGSLRASDNNVPEILGTQKYTLVYTDGINDFFLAQEQSHLKEHFRYPPNVFDGFYFPKDSRSSYSRVLREELSKMESLVKDLSIQNAELSEKLLTLENQLVSRRLPTFDRRVFQAVVYRLIAFRFVQNLSRFGNKILPGLHANLVRRIFGETGTDVSNYKLTESKFDLSREADAIFTKLYASRLSK